MSPSKTRAVPTPDTASARTSLELDSRFDGGFDPMRSISGRLTRSSPSLRAYSWWPDFETSQSDAGRSSSMRVREAEVKRMWVAEAARGIGLGRRILGELETQAVRRGAKWLVSRPTRRSAKPSASTEHLATRRWRHSTTSLTPITGSRRTSSAPSYGRPNLSDRIRAFGSLTVGV